MDRKYVSYLYFGVNYFFIFGLIMIFIAQGLVFYRVNAGSKTIGVKDSKIGLFDLIPIASDLITGSNVKLKGEEVGRTNFLVLGKDPEAGLTDTIIILSYFHSSKELSSINIPRDFYVTTPDIAGEKINGVISVIERYKKNTSGINYLKSFLEQEFAINIDYYASINLQGLVEAVDLVGGIDINIACTFTDYEYPNKNYQGFLRPAPTFRQGKETMNGERAVIYARSRKSLDCNEGSDFARSRRQSEVIKAILNKIQSTGLFENTSKINDYLSVVNKNLETNLTLGEISSLANKTKDINFSLDYNHYNLSTESKYLCDTRSTSGSYIIAYGDENNCGKFIAGNKIANIYRSGLRSVIQNLNSEAKDFKN
jgi:LCP family protein required for cell wall assembly